jgi:flagellar basal-body rod protein FlgC|tara:strand:+ start:256 stop:681 length:426 start_codon:yes stop_codon:yes gene_type:complete
MSLDKIIGIASTGMNAQMVRLNSTASNMANASTVGGSMDTAYKAKRPVFEALLREEQLNQGAPFLGGVKVAAMVDDKAVNRKILDPSNPKADKDGFVYASNVNEVTEMVEMMAAGRSYQNNVEVVNTAKVLMNRTLELTKV